MNNNSNGRGCAIFGALLPISYLIYLVIKPDPEIQKKNEEVNKIRTEYISRFNYNPDSLASKIFVMASFNNGTGLKKKYLVLDECIVYKPTP